MTLEACIAHALHSDLDIIEVLPEVHDLPVDQLECYIERYILETQNALERVICQHGEPFLRSRDPAGLCATCLHHGISLPTQILLRICHTIVELFGVDARYILQDAEGKSLYYVKLHIGERGPF